MPKSLPSRLEIVRKIRAIHFSLISREEASAWAMEVINDDEVDITDPDAWDVLTNIGGVDIIGGGDDLNDYLYGDEDLMDWENSLLSQPNEIS